MRTLKSMLEYAINNGLRMDIRCLSKTLSNKWGNETMISQPDAFKHIPKLLVNFITNYVSTQFEHGYNGNMPSKQRFGQYMTYRHGDIVDCHGKQSSIADIMNVFETTIPGFPRNLFINKHGIEKKYIQRAPIISILAWFLYVITVNVPIPPRCESPVPVNVPIPPRCESPVPVNVPVYPVHESRFSDSETWLLDALEEYPFLENDLDRSIPESYPYSSVDQAAYDFVFGEGLYKTAETN